MESRSWDLSSLVCRATALKLLKLLFPWHKGPTLPSHSLSCSCLFLGPSILNIGKRRCSTTRQGSPEFLSPGIGLFLVSCGRKSFPLTPRCQLRKFGNERSRSGTDFIASERYGGAPIACAHSSLVLPFCLFRNSTGKCTQIRVSRLTVHVLAVPYAGRAGWQSPVACCLPLVRYQLQVVCSRSELYLIPFCVRHLQQERERMTQPSKPFAESAHGMAQLAHGELFLRRRSAANRSGTKS